MKKLLAIGKMKCPKCYQGNLYKDNNPFHFTKLHAMHKHCEKCGQLFNPEPGFYMGAMYVSYGLCALVFVSCFFILYIGFGIPAWEFLIVYAILLALSFPFIFRYSRTIYLHLFYEYDPQAIAKHAEGKQ